MVPQVTFNLPPTDGEEPFQHHGQDCAKAGKDCRHSRHPGVNSAGLDLPAAKKNHIRRKVTEKQEQTIRDAEPFSLPGQEPNSPFQGRIPGQQDTDRRIEGEEGKTHGKCEGVCRLLKKYRQNQCKPPQNPCISQVIFMSPQITDKIGKHQDVPAAFYRAAAFPIHKIEGIGIRPPQNQQQKQGMDCENPKNGHVLSPQQNYHNHHRPQTPCPWMIPNRKENCRRQGSGIQLMLDESVHTIRDAAKICKAEAADIMNLKLMKCGGLYRGAQINAIGESFGVPCMVGCMIETKISITAGLSLVAAKKNITEADCDTFLFYKDGDTGMPGGFEIEGDQFRLLDRPGLGLDISF